RAVLVRDDVAVVTGRSVQVDELREDLAVRAVDRLDRALVAVPRHLDLVEALRLDDPGVVGREKAVHLEAGLLRHVLEERIPERLDGRALVGGNDAEVDLLRARDQCERCRYRRDEPLHCSSSVFYAIVAASTGSFT